MELRDLEYFMAMLEYGSLHEASRRLGISQPALSKCLARLERRFGSALFERSERGLRATAAGARLGEHARALTAACAKADHEVRLLGSGARVHLNIGVSPAFTEYLVPGACVEFCALRADVGVNVVTAMSDTLLPMLEKGDLDLVVSGIGPAPGPALRQELLMSERFVVVARRGHALAGTRAAIDIHKLSNERWILSAAAVPSRECLSAAFRGAGAIPPTPVIQTNSMAMMLNVIARSDLLGFLPQRVLRKSPLRASLRELPVRQLRWERRVGVTSRGLPFLSLQEREFLDILRRHAKANSEIR